MIKLFKSFIHPDCLLYLEKTLSSGHLAEGPRVKELEEELSKYFKTTKENITCVNSCTSALHLCLEFIKKDITSNRTEIISTPITCAATNMAIKMAGFDIKWADINDDLNIDCEDVLRKLSEKTAALVYVNWGGNPVDYKNLINIQNKYSRYYYQPLPIIEDAAHCWTNSNYNKPIINHYSCFSTQAIKYLTTGDGGFIITANDTWEDLKKMRWFGLDRTLGGFRGGQDIVKRGYKYHMNDVAASIGLANLPHIQANIDKQRENTLYLREKLEDCSCIELLDRKKNSSDWLFTILVSDRIDFEKKMAQQGVEVNAVHKRNDKLSCFAKYKCVLPTIDKLENRYVCIPNGWWLDKKELDYIIYTIKESV